MTLIPVKCAMCGGCQLGIATSSMIGFLSVAHVLDAHLHELSEPEKAHFRELRRMMRGAQPHMEKAARAARN